MHKGIASFSNEECYKECVAHGVLRHTYNNAITCTPLTWPRIFRIIDSFKSFFSTTKMWIGTLESFPRERRKTTACFLDGPRLLPSCYSHPTTNNNKYWKWKLQSWKKFHPPAVAPQWDSMVSFLYRFLDSIPSELTCLVTWPTALVTWLLFCFLILGLSFEK